MYLSPCDSKDSTVFTKWMNNSAITDGWGNSFGLIDEEKMVSRLSANQKSEYCFSVVKLEGDQLIGYCILYDFNKICRCASCGILIGEIGEQNKGYGTDALKLLLKFAFKSLNIHSINLGVYDFNKPAIKIYSRLGFQVIGTRRQCYFLNGQWHDEILMDLLCDEYLA